MSYYEARVTKCVWSTKATKAANKIVKLYGATLINKGSIKTKSQVFLG